MTHLLSNSDSLILGNNNKTFRKLHIDSITVYDKLGIGTNNPDADKHLHVTSSKSGVSVHIKCESSYADRNHIQLGATADNINRIYSRKNGSTECALVIETGSETYPMTFYQGGKVGINTGITNTGSSNSVNDPVYPLHVKSKHTDNISIKAEGNIKANSTTLSSDRRIKENIHEINDNSALKKLRSIECYYYNYIDKEGRGYDSVVGFIAQEVKEQLPMAVNLIKDIIPNEMRKIENPQWTEISPKSFKLTIPDLEDVSANTIYKFILRQDSTSPIKNVQSSTMEGDPKSFLFDRKYNEVFLYGKEVDDFHTLAKDKLFALNFSASQELDRVQQQEKTKLQAAEAKIALLETENTQLKADIAAIKSHLGI